MSDFPRGWTLISQTGGGGTASVTVPAVAGVVHVLDRFTAKLVALAGGAVMAANVQLSSSDGAFTSLNLGLLQTVGALTADEVSQSALDLAAGPGASLTVAYSLVTSTNNIEYLSIEGHDI